MFRVIHAETEEVVQLAVGWFIQMVEGGIVVNFGQTEFLNAIEAVAKRLKM